MFRLTHYLRALLHTDDAEPLPAARRGPTRPGPVVIWNLIRRCNLTCRHCYSISGDVDFPGELSTVSARRNACVTRRVICVTIPSAPR